MEAKHPGIETIAGDMDLFQRLLLKFYTQCQRKPIPVQLKNIEKDYEKKILKKHRAKEGAARETSSAQPTEEKPNPESHSANA